jgi:hypothetical protein
MFDLSKSSMKEAKRSHGQIDLSLLPASTWLSLQP